MTLKSIANNPDIDEIWERMHPAIEAALEALNKTLSPGPSPKGRGELKEWEVPFDLPEEWPAKAKESFDAFHRARRSTQEQMDAAIARNADQ